MWHRRGPGGGAVAAGGAWLAPGWPASPGDASWLYSGSAPPRPRRRRPSPPYRHGGPAHREPTARPDRQGLAFLRRRRRPPGAQTQAAGSGMGIKGGSTVSAGGVARGTSQGGGPKVSSSWRAGDAAWLDEAARVTPVWGSAPLPEVEGVPGAGRSWRGGGLAAGRGRRHGTVRSGGRRRRAAGGVSAGGRSGLGYAPAEAWERVPRAAPRAGARAVAPATRAGRSGAGSSVATGGPGWPGARETGSAGRFRSGDARLGRIVGILEHHVLLLAGLEASHEVRQLAAVPARTDELGLQHLGQLAAPAKGCSGSRARALRATVILHRRGGGHLAVDARGGRRRPRYFHPRVSLGDLFEEGQELFVGVPLKTGVRAIRPVAISNAANKVVVPCRT